MGLMQLEAALPGLQGLRLSVPDAIDWDGLEGELGFVFPVDYKILVESYAPFVISNLVHVFIPKPGFEDGYLGAVRDSLDYLEMDHDAGDVTEAPFREEGGLFPWATSSSGDTYYWRVVGGRTVAVVTQNRNYSFWEYSGGLADFLAGWCTANVRPVGQPSLDDWGGPRAIRLTWAG